MGDIVSVDEAVEALKNKGLTSKIMEGLHYHPSCKIEFSNDKKHAWLGQPQLIKNLENKFRGLVNNWTLKSLGTSKFLIIMHTEENEYIWAKDQKDYQSGVGMLLYLVKHLCPILATVAR